jgi:hypothetical protein
VLSQVEIVRWVALVSPFFGWGGDWRCHDACGQSEGGGGWAAANLVAAATSTRVLLFDCRRPQAPLLAWRVPIAGSEPHRTLALLCRPAVAGLEGRVVAASAGAGDVIVYSFESRGGGGLALEAQPPRARAETASLRRRRGAEQRPVASNSIYLPGSIVVAAPGAPGGMRLLRPGRQEVACLRSGHSLKQCTLLQLISVID